MCMFPIEVDTKSLYANIAGDILKNIKNSGSAKMLACVMMNKGMVKICLFIKPLLQRLVKFCHHTLRLLIYTSVMKMEYRKPNQP